MISREEAKKLQEEMRSNMSEYERGFVDGMQKQMQSSVDKAVNAMSRRELIDLAKSEFNIEKNVPLFKRYPFADMKPGDSFVVPKNIQRVTVYMAAKRYGERHNQTYAVRQTPEGLRCWRLE